MYKVDNGAPEVHTKTTPTKQHIDLATTSDSDNDDAEVIATIPSKRKTSSTTNGKSPCLSLVGACISCH